MSIIKITDEAIGEAADEVYDQLCGKYGDFTTPSTKQMRAVLAAALPYLVVEPEVVTTVEELDALPDDTAIRGHDGTYCRKNVDSEGGWSLMEALYDAPTTSADVAKFLPATVVYRPAKEDV